MRVRPSLLLLLLLDPLLLPGGQDPAQTAVEAEHRGDFAAAVDGFKQAIRSGEDSPELRSNLGVAYFQLGDNNQALEQFRISLAKRPGFVPPNLFSGLCLLRLQHPKEALPFLEKAHSAQPDAPDILLALARAQVATDNISIANSLYGQATRLSPQSAEAWFGLGITDRSLAEMELKTARHLGQGSGSPATQKARALLEASQAAIEKGLQFDPDSVRARMIFAESFRIAERYADSIREYQAAIKQKPDLAAAWTGLAAAYSASGDSDNAVKAANRAIEIDPNDGYANALLAGLYMRAGDYSKAKSYAERAVRIQPDLSTAHLVLAKVYLSQNQAAEAVPELEQAVKADVDGSAYYLLASTLNKLGKSQEAAAALRKYRALHNAYVARK